MKICVYTEDFKQEWDNFISTSKNGTFLFFRDYMEYHSDRFKDFSLLFFDDTGLIAVMPANREGDRIVSHAGLTYGGIVSDSRMKTPTMLEIFNSLKRFLSRQGIVRILYKTVPYIYHVFPADEDLYALFIQHANLVGRHLLSVLDMKNQIPFQERRLRSLRKAMKYELVCRQSEDFASFWRILTQNLNVKYNIQPIHTADEIQLLWSRFRENIKLFTSCQDDVILAGAVIYESKNVAHVQYTAANDEGRDKGALDILFDYLLNKRYFEKKRYFDFGISTEGEGRYLNTGLIENKEGFGARTVAHDFYEINF